MQNGQTGTSELLNRGEAAAFLRLSAGTLANWQSTGRQKIPFVKLGRRIFYKRGDLKKFIEGKTQNLEG